MRQVIDRTIGVLSQSAAMGFLFATPFLSYPIALGQTPATEQSATDPYAGLSDEVKATLVFMEQQKASAEQIKSYKQVILDAYQRPTEKDANHYVTQLKKDFVALIDETSRLVSESESKSKQNPAMGEKLEARDAFATLDKAPTCEALTKKEDSGSGVWTLVPDFKPTKEWALEFLKNPYRLRKTRIRFSATSACPATAEPILVETIAPILGKNSNGQSVMFGYNPLPQDKGQISAKHGGFFFHIPFIYTTAAPPAKPAAPAKPVTPAKTSANKTAGVKPPAKPTLDRNAPTPPWTLQHAHGPDQEPIPNRAARLFCRAPKVADRANLTQILHCIVYPVYKEGEDGTFTYQALPNQKPEDTQDLLFLKLSEVPVLPPEPPKKVEPPKTQTKAPEKAEPASQPAPRKSPRPFEPDPQQPGLSTTPRPSTTPSYEGPTLFRAGVFRYRAIHSFNGAEQKMLDTVPNVKLYRGEVVASDKVPDGNFCTWKSTQFKISTMAMRTVIVDVQGMVTVDKALRSIDLSANNVALKEQPTQVLKLTIEDAERQSPSAAVIGELECEFPGMSIKKDIKLAHLQEIFGAKIKFKPGKTSE